MTILINVGYHLAQLLVEVLLLVKNVVLIIGLFKLVVRKHVECITNFLFSHVVISQNTWITIKIRVFLVFKSFKIEILGRLEVLKLRETLDLKYIVVRLRSLCYKVLRVHVKLSGKYQKID